MVIYIQPFVYKEKENIYFYFSIMFRQKQRQSTESDGWDADQLIIQQLEQKKLFRFRGEKGLNLLELNQHSLQPDMISGWRPKLPSCPLPLSYTNTYIDRLKFKLFKQQSKNVIYIGPRPSNSVQVNQKYTYFWKYRARYSINMNIIKEAIQNVGAASKEQNLSLVQNQHIFDSAFQSGNLDLAIKVKRNQYDCFIRSDTNTKGHTNWFYFKVINGKDIGPIRINICNFTKSKSLYSQGMRPYCKTKDAEWSQQPCYDIFFGQKQCKYGLGVQTYCLEFTYNFRKPLQQVYFAYSIPYTYSDLQNFIAELKNEDYKYLKITSLCQSLGGISLPLLIINSQFSQQLRIANRFNRTKKKVALITARIHPGQSNSSFLLEGFVRNVLNCPQLLSRYIFYIVPMLNPDGVIIGNFRTSYSGKDLNRQFNRLNKYIFPQIYGLKQLTQKIKSNWQTIQFYFDFHGHSLKKNLFCYGPEHKPKSTYNLQARAFTKIIERENKIFDYKSSIFVISESKRNTARAYMLEKLNIPMSFTFQISNGLYEDQNKVCFLDKETVKKAGEAISNSFISYIDLQNRIPKKVITAKIDSGKYERRVYYFNKSTKNLKSYRKVNQDSSCNLLNTTQQPKLSAHLIQILNQIKKQLSTNVQTKVKQNGSDSEASQEDLTKQQSQALFQNMINQKTISDYRKTLRNDEKQNEINLLKLEEISKQNQILEKEIRTLKKNKTVNFSKKSPNPKNRKQVQDTVSKFALPSKHYTFFI